MCANRWALIVLYMQKCEHIERWATLDPASVAMILSALGAAMVMSALSAAIRLSAPALP